MSVGRFLQQAAAGNAGGFSWSGDVSTATFVQNFSISSQETGVGGVSFKDDGTKMYVVGFIGDDVNEYNLSTEWDISTASYVQNFSFSSQDTNVNGIFFKDDGTKMYMAGGSGANIYEYNLSTAWDVSTASYVQNFNVNSSSIPLASRETNPYGPFIGDDGTKMYVSGTYNDSIHQYDLSTGWDISTASFVRTLDLVSYDTNVRTSFFSGDGLKMYFTGTQGDDVNEFDLSTAWDISTASFVQNKSLGLGDHNGLFFKSDGTKMYIADSNADVIKEYDLD